MRLDENPYRPPEVALEPPGPEVPSYRPGRPLATSTVVMLYVTIPLDAAHGARALLWPVAPIFDESPQTLVFALVLSEVVALVNVLVHIACVVLFCVWFHRAYGNLLALGEPRLRFAPGWAPGSFFVPILNLFRPYQIAREIWQKSGGDSGGLVAAWWTLFLTSGAVGLLDGRLPLEPTQSRVITVLGTLLSAAAAVVTALMIRGVVRRQERRFQRQLEEPPR
jgi:hypothetical protein